MWVTNIVMNLGEEEGMMIIIEERMKVLITTMSLLGMIEVIGTEVDLIVQMIAIQIIEEIQIVGMIQVDLIETIKIEMIHFVPMTLKLLIVEDQTITIEIPVEEVQEMMIGILTTIETTEAMGNLIWDTETIDLVLEIDNIKLTIITDKK